jgi:hypothetical protein
VLQLFVGFGLLNNIFLSSIFSIRYFYMDGLLAHHRTLNLVWFLSFNLPGKGDPASSYATTAVALRDIRTHKPPRHVKA